MSLLLLDAFAPAAPTAVVVPPNPGLGRNPFGRTPFGDRRAGTALFSVVSAWAISTHSVRVTFTERPRAVDSFDPTDALNPLVWVITNDTAGQALTVASITMADEFTADVTTLEALGDDLDTHTVTIVGMVAETGDVIAFPVSATFAGVVQTIDPVDSRRVDLRDRDLANPPFQVQRGLGYAGTLIIGEDGDFTTEAGNPLIKKLVLRRMNTVRSSFRHLPNYGAATLEKEPIASGGNLVAYIRELENQAKQEPDVIDARGRGSIDRNGVLIIQLAIIASGGTVSMKIGQRGGQIVEL